ncbi:MAG: FHA domain-containing protein [Planctomycetota bacterium]
MELKLVVATGARAGEEVSVAGPKFFIGRAEDCQLRPRSDLVSRHHCAITVEEGFVGVREFGSKNGTFVNGEQVRGERELKNGDRLKVGDLEFEVQLNVAIGGTKKPKVQSVQEAAARTIESTVDDMDLDSWLGDTDTKTLETKHSENAGTETVTSATPDDEARLPKEKPKKKPKKEGKIAGVWDDGSCKTTAATPTDAAASTLKNFFRGRG